MRQFKNNFVKSTVAALFGFTAFAFSGPVSFADHHCSCDDKCTEQCSKGEHQDCKCEHCDCAKGKKCKHGKCARHKHAAESDAAPAAQPAAH